MTFATRSNFVKCSNFVYHMLVMVTKWTGKSAILHNAISNFIKNNYM